jgi:hypothetical protein
LHQLEQYKATKYPNLDIDRALLVLAQQGDRQVNLDKLCEVVEARTVESHESYLRSKMQDPNYVNEMVRKHGTAQRADPPQIPPSSGGDVPGSAPVKITRSNAAKVFAQRLKDSGWAGRGREVPAEN